MVHRWRTLAHSGSQTQIVRRRAVTVLDPRTRGEGVTSALQLDSTPRRPRHAAYPAGKLWSRRCTATGPVIPLSNAGEPPRPARPEQDIPPKQLLQGNGHLRRPIRAPAPMIKRMPAEAPIEVQPPCASPSAKRKTPIAASTPAQSMEITAKVRWRPSLGVTSCTPELFHEAFLRGVYRCRWSHTQPPRPAAHGWSTSSAARRISCPAGEPAVPVRHSGSR